MATQAGPAKLTPGESVPDFTLPSLSGREVHLRDYLGRKLIVFMWASW